MVDKYRPIIACCIRQRLDKIRAEMRPDATEMENILKTAGMPDNIAARLANYAVCMASRVMLYVELSEEAAKN